MKKEAFDEIYRNNVWGYKSGPGSEPGNAQEWITIVNEYLNKKDIKSVVDIGCGDWRLGAEYNLAGKSYLGIEVSSVIFKETVKNSTPNICFINEDAEAFNFPKVDLVLIKDVLQHLPNSSVRVILDKVYKSAKYALICEDYSTEALDTVPGGYRGIDLSKEPLSLLTTFQSTMFTKQVRLYQR